ncbi:MAG TPA: ABC transporter permease [Gemmatimonadales bacterium]|nr:ABC transporter permease [Gemmatimonadales bacterium]
MRAYLAELFRSYELLYVFAWRDIKIKYKQSVMGYLWALLMPMIIVTAGVLVRFAFVRISGTGMDRVQIATVAVKAVAWAFFVSALRFGTGSLIGNANLVTKIRFPKAVFPLAAVVSSVFDLAIAGATVIVLLLVMGVRFTPEVLWVPVQLAILAVFVFGLTGLLAVANLYFRDVKYLVEVIVTFAIFFTPVFYDASVLGRWQHLAMLNPVAPVLEGLAAVVVRAQPPPLAWTAYSAALGVGLSIATLYTFAVLEPQFAENI